MPRDPSRTVGELRRSVQGCAWLIERWVMLASVAERGRWTDGQQALAQDLLGTPSELRGDAPGFTVGADGRTVDTGADELALAHMMLAELRLHQERIIAADESARQLAMADLDDFNNPDLLRLRRYERSLRRELHRPCELSQFESPQAIHHQFAPATPADRFEPSSVPNEPIAAVPPVVPNEPTTAVSLVLPNEPTSANQTNPFTTNLAATTTAVMPPKRPNLARLAKREREARRRRGR